ncbi:MAG: glycosyltransferase [Sphaerochaetaceae bacterium]
MKILLVCDQFFGANNGTTISARRFSRELEKNGNEVKVLCAGNKDQGDFCLDAIHFPLFDGLITSQGMTFAKVNPKIISKAVDWADIVHVYVPFALARKTIKICREKNKPFTAAFHVQPENITSSIHMANFALVNFMIYQNFKRHVYQYCNHVHCPSKMIANELVKHGYKSQLHVISNGIDPYFKYIKREKPLEYKDKFLILNIGRFSIEKKQDVLIRAINSSKYANKIQLILAGQGPRKKNLEKLGKILKNKPVMNFYSREDLLDIISKCDLYVHPANVEIEAMACMEAFAGGLVPIIAKSPISATSQFALNSNCLFNCGDEKELTEKIDWWLDHESERKTWEIKYSEYAKEYSQKNCVLKIEEMFEKAIEENG